MKIKEIAGAGTIKTSKPKSAEDLRIDALKATKERTTTALKQAQAQKKMANARQALASANKTL